MAWASVLACLLLIPVIVFAQEPTPSPSSPPSVSPASTVVPPPSVSPASTVVPPPSVSPVLPPPSFVPVAPAPAPVIPTGGNGHHGLSGGAKAGIAFGVIIGLVVGGCAAYICTKRRANQKKVEWGRV